MSPLIFFFLLWILFMHFIVVVFFKNSILLTIYFYVMNTKQTKLCHLWILCVTFYDHNHLQKLTDMIWIQKKKKKLEANGPKRSHWWISVPCTFLRWTSTSTSAGAISLQYLRIFNWKSSESRTWVLRNPYISFLDKYFWFGSSLV